MEKTGSIILQKARKHGQKPFLAAIDGRCAAGKTTLAEWLQKETGCPVIHMDHFFLRREQRSRQRLLEPGGNVDYERFLSEVMIPLSRGQEFSYRPFDCKTMELSAPVAIKPSGLSVIRQRNGEEALSLFRERWIPMEETYFSAFRIRERCDLVFQEEEIQ